MYAEFYKIKLNNHLDTTLVQKKEDLGHIYKKEEENVFSGNPPTDVMSLI